MDLITRYGSIGVLDAGASRGKDFQQNQSQGAWAETLLLAAEPCFVTFGPSDGVIPGEIDYLQRRLRYREIAILDGKRPDLIHLTEESLDEHPEVRTWIYRPLWKTDAAALARVSCAVEVKSSLFDCARRRQAGLPELSVTLKEEEVTPLTDWQAKFGVEVIVLQVFIDEVHSMTLDGMVAAIADGRARKRTDPKTGKPTFTMRLAGDHTRRARIEVDRGCFRIAANGSVERPQAWPPARLTGFTFGRT